MRFTPRAGELLHPAQESEEALRRLRHTLGEYHFSSQYQQSPMPVGGGIVKRDWLQAYEPHEIPQEIENVIQSWDTATKSTQLADYSVCTTWGLHDKTVYLLDVWRKKVDYPALKAAAIELARRYRPKTILVEDKSSGTPLIQELAQVGIYCVKPCRPTLEKAVRLSTVTGLLETGQVRFPVRAPWWSDYLTELITFPRGRYDDQVDSTPRPSNGSAIPTGSRRCSRSIGRWQRNRLAASRSSRSSLVGCGRGGTAIERGTAMIVCP